MIHWKIILLLIIIKILSFILGNYYPPPSINLNEKKIMDIKSNIGSNSINNSVEYETNPTNICISPESQEFMFEWVRFTMVMIDYSKSIIRNENTDPLYLLLEKSKDKLVELFDKIHQNINEQEKFKQIMNKQIYYKMNLCIGVKINNQNKIKEYYEKLTSSNKQLEELFISIRKDKKNESQLTKSFSTHTNLYVKSLGVMKNVTDSELTRELVLGSIDTVKLLLIG